MVTRRLLTEQELEDADVPAAPLPLDPKYWATEDPYDQNSWGGSWMDRLTPEGIFKTAAAIPGSPEAGAVATKGAADGDLSFRMYGPNANFWDVAAGGTELSQDPKARDIGRTVGTVMGGYFAAPALSGAMGGGLAGAAGSGATIGAVTAAGAGGNRDEILSGALRGGLTAGAGYGFTSPTQLEGWDAAMTDLAKAGEINPAYFPPPSYTGAAANDFYDIPQSEFTTPPAVAPLPPEIHPEDSWMYAPGTPAAEALPAAPLPAEPVYMPEQLGSFPEQVIEVTTPRLPAEPPTKFNPAILDSPDWDPAMDPNLAPPTTSPPSTGPEQKVEVTGRKDQGPILTLPRGSEVLPAQQLNLEPPAQEPPIEVSQEPIPEPNPAISKPFPYKDLLKALLKGGQASLGSGGFSGMPVANALRGQKFDDSLPTMFDPNYRAPKEANVY